MGVEEIISHGAPIGVDPLRKKIDELAIEVTGLKDRVTTTETEIEKLKQPKEGPK